MRYLTFIFILACTLPNAKMHSLKSKAFSNLEIKVEDKNDFLKLEKAMEWFKSLKLRMPKNLKKLGNSYIDIFNQIEVIEVSSRSCADGIFACVYPDRKDRVFVKPVVLKFPKEQIISSLLHEQVHHLTNYNHKRCHKVPHWQHECDDNELSAYGIEFHFFQSLHKKIDRPNQDLINHFKQRINFL